jgi:hypothetical protein
MSQLKNNIANMFVLSIHYVQDGIEKNTPDLVRITRKE